MFTMCYKPAHRPSYSLDPEDIFLQPTVTSEGKNEKRADSSLTVSLGILKVG